MAAGLFSPTHLLVLGFVALVLFGAKRVPEMGRSLGLGMREFKSSISGEGTEQLTALPEPASTDAE
jgi:sec-independent protein translocase protein TatA